MKKLDKILESMSAIVLLFMFVCVLLQVLFRSVLKISATWTEEFARMGYIWMVFLMLPVLESRDEQLKVTYFFDKIPYKGRVALYWVMSICYVLVLAVMIAGGVYYYRNTMTLNFASVKWLLMSYQYIPIVLGGITGILFVIRRALHFKEALAAAEAEYEV